MIDIQEIRGTPERLGDVPTMRAFAEGKRIMVTGGAGSIGSVLCERLASLSADVLAVDNSEPALHRLLTRSKGVDGRIGDVRDAGRVGALIAGYKPDVIFHAAALKHVHLLERDWEEGLATNLMGTINVAQAAVAHKVSTVVLVSTDKAVEPVSVLGASKRLAELYCQGLDLTPSHNTRLTAVRFGNVLGSAGSVVPMFEHQIADGGPVTVTHPDMERFFMTIREACDLMVMVAERARGDSRGTIYVLDMGDPVKIMALAKHMVAKAYREQCMAADRDVDRVDIVVTGIRPGEKLSERLVCGSSEKLFETRTAGIRLVKPLDLQAATVAAHLVFEWRRVAA